MGISEELNSRGAALVSGLLDRGRGCGRLPRKPPRGHPQPDFSGSRLPLLPLPSYKAQGAHVTALEYPQAPPPPRPQGPGKELIGSRLRPLWLPETGECSFLSQGRSPAFPSASLSVSLALQRGGEYAPHGRRTGSHSIRCAPSRPRP